MTTYKFLAKGALGPISGFAWPVPRGGEPGAWVEVEGPLVQCARGVHVCRTLDLAHWIHDELWEVEAAGDATDGVDCVVVQRARLVRPIDAWSAGGGLTFANASVAHAVAEVGSSAADEVNELLDDARFMAENAYVALAAFTAALVVGRAAGAESPERVYRRERAWQGEWIARALLGTPS
jgi:hypothetical protein